MCGHDDELPYFVGACLLLSRKVVHLHLLLRRTIEADKGYEFRIMSYEGGVVT